MNKKNKSAFTLIELLVVMTIIWLVTMFTYWPYLFYKKKASLRVAVKEISQDLYLARSMAINWISSWTWVNSKNYSVWLFLDSWENKNIIFYWYTWSNFNISSFTNWEILKKIPMENNIEIKDISSKSWALFYFSAIKWEPKVFLWDSSNLTESWWVEYKINISYKWTNSDILLKKIKYNTKTFVIDY